MFIPVNLHYTSNHLWLRDVGRQDVYVGITDYAQKELGRIGFIEIKYEGSLKKKGDIFGAIYGANKCVDLIMPFAGRILMINPDIEMHPGILNSDPYHYWVILLAITNGKGKNSETYFTADKYKEAINRPKTLTK